MKRFLIIGLKGAVTYKDVFPLIKDGEMTLGINPVNVFVSGDEIKKFGNIGWFSNLKNNREKKLVITEKYSPDKYPKYDNYDAIDSKTKDIPVDYDGVMGVPITFLDEYNPNQFEIIKFRKGDDDKDLSINGKCTYSRILIKRKK